MSTCKTCKDWTTFVANNLATKWHMHTHKGGRQTRPKSWLHVAFQVLDNYNSYTEGCKSKKKVSSCIHSLYFNIQGVGICNPHAGSIVSLLMWWWRTNGKFPQYRNYFLPNQIRRYSSAGFSFQFFESLFVSLTWRVQRSSSCHTEIFNVIMYIVYCSWWCENLKSDPIQNRQVFRLHFSIAPIIVRVVNVLRYLRSSYQWPIFKYMPFVFAHHNRNPGVHHLCPNIQDDGTIHL